MKSSVEDLSARARRGELGESELLELEQLIESSHEARLAHQAGQEFDAEDSVLAGDEALATRINQKLFERRAEPRPSRRFRAIGLVVGGVCTTVAAAAAGPGLLHQMKFLLSDVIEVRAPAAPQTPPQASNAGRAPRSVASIPNAAPTVSAAIAPDAPTPSAGAGSESRAKRSAAKPTVESTETETSAALFARASLARRQGAVRQATELYARLLRRFPGSPEAAQAEVTLGSLRLQSGAPGASLGHFERYLARYPGGALAAEALWGKTRALAALGRDDEARRNLLMLIERYPRSTYATAARSKLGLSP